MFKKELLLNKSFRIVTDTDDRTLFTYKPIGKMTNIKATSLIENIVLSNNNDKEYPFIDTIQDISFKELTINDDISIDMSMLTNEEVFYVRELLTNIIGIKLFSYE